MLYFGASWCGPCKRLKEKLENEKEEIPRLKVLHLDCDVEDNELIVEDWNIESLPTQIFVHVENKNVVKDERIEGFDWIKLIFSYKEIIEKRNDYSIDDENHVKV